MKIRIFGLIIENASTWFKWESEKLSKNKDLGSIKLFTFTLSKEQQIIILLLVKAIVCIMFCEISIENWERNKMTQSTVKLMDESAQQTTKWSNHDNWGGGFKKSEI